MNTHRRLKILILTLTLIAALGLSVGCTDTSMPPIGQIGQTTEPTFNPDLVTPIEAEPIRSITVNGAVESTERRNVYSTLGDIIARVNVEVGDVVTSGQLLAVIDTGIHDIDITIAQGNAGIASASIAAESASLEVDTLRNTYERFAVLYLEGAIAQIEYRQAKDALAFAENNYRHARQHVSSLSAAQQILLDARSNRVDRQHITAPIGGTITAALAREGEIAHGILFVIEDTDNLRITARFREYDLAKISVGTPVTITSDATGNVEYSGYISRISQSAVRDAFGNIAPIVEFEAEITITSEETDLRIGMTTRVTVDINGSHEEDINGSDEEEIDDQE